MTKQVCPCCQEELFELVFSTRWVVFLCDNHLCQLYRQPQGKRPRQEWDLSLREIRLREQEGPKTSTQLPRKRPSEYSCYRPYQARQNENYREARRLGATAKQAQGARTDKSFRSLVTWLGERSQEKV